MKTGRVCFWLSRAALLVVALIAQGVLSQNVTTYSLPAIECKRFTTAQGVFGCQSPTMSGPVYGVSTAAELDAFVAKASRLEKWIVSVPAIMFNQETLTTLRKGPLGGLIVGSSNPNVSYSTESKCPNCQWGLYATDKAYPWNPQGNGFTYESFNIPIFLATPEFESYVKELVKANVIDGKDYTTFPLVGLEMAAFQFANVNSEKCLSRGFCDPVFSSSVWSTFSPQLKASDGKKLFMLTTQIDSFGVFTDYAQGAYSRITGLVTVLAAAQTLQKLTNPATFKHHLAFALFNTEAVGFGGSSRFYKDVADFKCVDGQGPNFCNQPYYATLNFTQLNLTRLAGTIHIDSIGNGNLFAHIEDRLSGNPSKGTLDLLAAITSLNKNVTRAKGSTPANPKGIPPTSAMSLLSSMPSSPVVVLSDYDESFSSIYHGTWLDSAKNLPLNTSSRICEAVGTVVRSLWLLANETQPPENVTVDCALIDTMLTCFSQNLDCSFLTNFVNVTAGSFGSSTYANIPGFAGSTKYSRLAAYVLANYSTPEFGPQCDGNVLNFCTNDKDAVNQWDCIGFRCVRSTAFLHPAWDLGLEWDYTARRFYVANKSKPALCESRFATIRLTAGLVNSTGQEIGLLFGAIIANCIVAGVIVWVSRYVRSHSKQD